MNSFYSQDEVQNLGFKSVGTNVLISRKASIYGHSGIEIGNNVRIDDFVFMSGKVKLNNYIHIPTASMLYGGEAGIEMEDFSSVSQRVTVLAMSDDYSGNSMTNPTVPIEYKEILHAHVLLKRHVIVGACSTVLPGVTLEEGCSVGAMSLVTKSTQPWTINVGIPARRIKDRERKILELEENLRKATEGS